MAIGGSSDWGGWIGPSNTAPGFHRGLVYRRRGIHIHSGIPRFIPIIPVGEAAVKGDGNEMMNSREPNAQADRQQYALAGELDYHRAGKILHELMVMGERGLNRIDVDLSRVQRMDTAIVAVLLSARHLLFDRQIQLHLQRPSPAASDKFSLCRLNTLLE